MIAWRLPAVAKYGMHSQFCFAVLRCCLAVLCFCDRTLGTEGGRDPQHWVASCFCLFFVGGGGGDHPSPATKRHPHPCNSHSDPLPPPRITPPNHPGHRNPTTPDNKPDNTRQQLDNTLDNNVVESVVELLLGVVGFVVSVVISKCARINHKYFC